MFPSFKCAGMEYKWQADSLCVWLVGWVKAITPGWPGEPPDNRSCPTRGGLLSLEQLKRWTADLPQEPQAGVEGGFKQE